MKTKKKLIYILIGFPLLVSLSALGIFAYTMINAKSISDLFVDLIGNRYAIISVFSLFIIISALIYIAAVIASRKKLSIVFGIFLLLIAGVSTFTSYEIIKINDSLDKFEGENEYKAHTTFVVLNDSALTEEADKEEKNYSNVKMGILTNEQSYDGNILPKFYQEENPGITEVIEYNSWVELLEGLENKEVDLIPFPVMYEELYNTPGFENKSVDDIVVIDEMKKTLKLDKKEELDGSKPFSILIVAVDKNIVSDNINGLYDVVVLVTVVPDSGEIYMNSINRDSLFKSTCMNDRYDKITHTGNPYLGKGTDCIVETIEEGFDTKIDYSLVADFGGLIDIVDFLDGVYIDNTYGDFRGQDENRVKYSVFVPGGYNLLNGQQTLSWARNRKQGNIVGGAIERANAHSEVIKAILNRLEEKNILFNISPFLDVVAENTYTDFPLNDLVELNKIVKNVAPNGEFDIKTVSLEGRPQQYSSPWGRQKLSGVAPYIDSYNFMIEMYNKIRDDEPYQMSPEFDLTDSMKETDDEDDN